MGVTTTASPASGPLGGVTGTMGLPGGQAFDWLNAEPLETLGAQALSEVARSATLAQNLAAATRLEAAHHLVQSMRQLDAEAHPGTGGDRPPRPAHARLDPADRARDYLAAALTVTCWHAGRLVTAGVQIHTRLPRLRSAVARGLMPEQLAIDTACRLAQVPDATLPAVESEVIDQLCRHLDGGHRPSRGALDAIIDAATGRHDPATASDAAARAHEQRTVRFRPARNGMATMWANLPSADAEKLRRRIEAAARAAAEAGHPRTRDQLRADALAALGDPTTNDIGTPLHNDHDPEHSADPSTPDSTADGAAPNAWVTDKPIRISVISSIAQGLPNRVEFVRGAYASLDWLCEELLAGGDAKVRFEVIDPAPGVLDTPDAVLKYPINAALAERIRLRDGTCRHPGCTVDAQHCDIDHVIAFDHHRPELGGPTAEWNLACLCRKHHREKTFGHHAYRPGPLGELIILTDTGHEHRTTPTGPLAHARNQILEHQWRQHLDRLIDHDGQLTNPPGNTRRPWTP